VKRLPPVLWRKKVGEGIDPFGGGRVLIIDLFSRGKTICGPHEVLTDESLDASENGRRHTQSNECTTVDQLKEFYKLVGFLIFDISNGLTNGSKEQKRIIIVSELCKKTSYIFWN